MLLLVKLTNLSLMIKKLLDKLKKIEIKIPNLNIIRELQNKSPKKIKQSSVNGKSIAKNTIKKSSLFSSINFKPGLFTKKDTDQPLVGIDLSDRYLKIAVLINKAGTWTLDKYISRPIQTEANDPKDLLTVQQEVLSQALKDEKINIDTVATALPAQSVVIQTIDVPFLDDNALNQAAENGSLWKNNINLPGELKEYSVFWQILNKNKDANNIQILFVGAKHKDIVNHTEIFNKIKISPAIIDVRPFSLATIVKELKQTNSSTVLVELSGDENYALFSQNDQPFIVDIFVSDNDQELLKKGGKIEDASIFTRLSAQIKLAIQSFIKQNENANIKEAMLLSTCTSFESISKGIIKELNSDLKVSVYNPMQNISIPPSLAEAVNKDINSSSMSIALSLGLKRLANAPDHLGAYYKINLLPNRNELMAEEKRRAKTETSIKSASLLSTIVAALTVLVSILMTLFYPSSGDVETLLVEQSEKQNILNKIKEEEGNYKKWIVDINQKNNHILNYDYLKSLPRGVFIVNLKHNRMGKSEISIRSVDPNLVNLLVERLAKIHHNVRLVDVSADPKNGDYQLSRITFEIK